MCEWALLLGSTEVSGRPLAVTVPPHSQGPSEATLFFTLWDVRQGGSEQHIRRAFRSHRSLRKCLQSSKGQNNSSDSKCRHQALGHPSSWNLKAGVECQFFFSLTAGPIDLLFCFYHLTTLSLPWSLVH